MRIADEAAHRRFTITVLAAGLLKDGSQILYVRREETEFTGPVPHRADDAFRRDAKTGTWQSMVLTKAQAAFLTGQEPGAMGRCSGRFIEVIDPSEIETEPVLVIEPPLDGWTWTRRRRSPREEANIRFNFGLPQDAPLPYVTSASVA